MIPCAGGRQRPAPDGLSEAVADAHLARPQRTQGRDPPLRPALRSRDRVGPCGADLELPRLLRIESHTQRGSGLFGNRHPQWLPDPGEEAVGEDGIPAALGQHEEGETHGDLGHRQVGIAVGLNPESHIAVGAAVAALGGAVPRPAGLAVAVVETGRTSLHGGHHHDQHQSALLAGGHRPVQAGLRCKVAVDGVSLAVDGHTAAVGFGIELHPGRCGGEIERLAQSLTVSEADQPGIHLCTFHPKGHRIGVIGEPVIDRSILDQEPGNGKLGALVAHQADGRRPGRALSLVESVLDDGIVAAGR